MAPAFLADRIAPPLGRVDWYNNQRLLGPIGYIPRAEAEAVYYTTLENLDMAA